MFDLDVNMLIICPNLRKAVRIDKVSIKDKQDIEGYLSFTININLTFKQKFNIIWLDVILD